MIEYKILYYCAKANELRNNCFKIMSARNIEVLLHAVRYMNSFSDEDAQTTALVL